MDGIARLIMRNWRAAWLLLLTACLLSSWAAMEASREYEYRKHRLHLAVEAERGAVEITALTLNGKIMGATSLLGLIPPEIKITAEIPTPDSSRRVDTLFDNVARFHGIDGMFLIGKDGVIRSAWASRSTDRPSVGIDVHFRPYFQMADQGQENVYAAVSIARNDRSLFFAVPVFESTNSGSPTIGVVVSRTDTDQLDRLLKGHGEFALLLSPQGVVFASTHPEWIGFLAETPTPERLQAIRDLKQFGGMFENKEPSVLPLDTRRQEIRLEGHSVTLESAPISWNDPSGNWTLLLGEDLRKAVPLLSMRWIGLASFAFLLALGTLSLQLLRGNHARQVYATQLASHSERQIESMRVKAALTIAGQAMQQAEDRATAIGIFFQQAQLLLGARQGVLYLQDPAEPASFVLAGAYACHDGAPTALKLGEGLLGQCALDGEIRVVSAPDPSFWTIRSGLGESMPTALFLGPVILNGRLLGVVELALLRTPDSDARDHLAELLLLLALNLDSFQRAALYGQKQLPTGDHVPS